MADPLSPDRRAGLVVAGALATLMVAVVLGVLAPASDPALSKASAAHPAHVKGSDEGRQVYRDAGCWYCHTQQIRGGVGADADLGAAREAGDYHMERPAMLGTERIGPDLTHGSTRDQFVRSHAPYLSRKQQDALIAYLHSLQ